MCPIVESESMQLYLPSFHVYVIVDTIFNVPVQGSLIGCQWTVPCRRGYIYTAFISKSQIECMLRKTRGASNWRVLKCFMLMFTASKRYFRSIKMKDKYFFLLSISTT